MSLDSLRRRIERIERTTRESNRIGRFPVVRVITESDEDRDRQLAALQAAGRYQPGQFVIDRRIVSPEDTAHELRRPAPPTAEGRALH